MFCRAWRALAELCERDSAVSSSESGSWWMDELGGRAVGWVLFAVCCVLRAAHHGCWSLLRRDEMGRKWREKGKGREEMSPFEFGKIRVRHGHGKSRVFAMVMPS